MFAHFSCMYYRHEFGFHSHKKMVIIVALKSLKHEKYGGYVYATALCPPWLLAMAWLAYIFSNSFLAFALMFNSCLGYKLALQKGSYLSTYRIWKYEQKVESHSLAAVMAGSGKSVAVAFCHMPQKVNQNRQKHPLNKVRQPIKGFFSDIPKLYDICSWYKVAILLGKAYFIALKNSSLSQINKHSHSTYHTHVRITLCLYFICVF